MSQYTDRERVRSGLIGLAVVVFVTLVALNLNNLPFVNGGHEVRIEFREAGGLKVGGPVLVSGLKVGHVDSIKLSGTHVDVVVKLTDDEVDLGRGTSAALVTTTVLGSAAVTLKSSGTGELADSVIPLGRTSSPYDVTQALSELTTTVGEIDTGQLAKSLTTVATAFAGTPQVLNAALTGVNRLSTTISNRDAQIRDLFASTSKIGSIVAARGSEIDKLLTDGASLLAQLNARRQVVDALFSNVAAVSQEIQTTIRGSGARLAPALHELDQFTQLLNRNRTKLQETIEGLNGYIAGLGDAVSSGPYFDGYIVNLTNPGSLAPQLSQLLAGSSGGKR